jgi:hypothetical protein
MTASQNVLAGVAEDGTDDEPSNRSAFLANVRERQEAVWAMLCHGRVVVDENWYEDNWGSRWVLNRLGVYLPPEHVRWYQANQEAADRTVAVAIRAVWSDQTLTHKTALDLLQVEQILPVPAHLIDFVARNTGRPMPRRYNSTAVKYTERDGIAWLTPPEVILYDLFKEASWLFVPQAPFVLGDVHRSPDFLVYWKSKHDQALIVEVDSDAFHLPSQREPDEARERSFQARGFQFVRFPAKRVLNEPLTVMADIRRFCEARWGK